MKDRINFLDMYHTGARLRAKARMVVMGLGVLILLVIVFQGWRLGDDLAKLERECRALRAQTSDTNTLRDRYFQLEAEREKLKSSLEGLEELVKRSAGIRKLEKRWAPIFIRLARELPAGVWFDRIEITPPTVAQAAGLALNDFRIRLTGRTFSQEDLLQFISILEREPVWRSVVLGSVHRLTDDKSEISDLSRYEIILDLAL